MRLYGGVQPIHNGFILKTQHAYTVRGMRACHQHIAHDYSSLYPVPPAEDMGTKQSDP